MSTLIRIAALAAVAACCAFAEPDIAGDWNGTLKTDNGYQRLVLHLAKDSSGAYKGSLDSLDQATNGIPVSAITLKGSKLTFKVASVNWSFEGQVNEASTLIDGNWMQGDDRPLPLSFERARADNAASKLSDIDGSWLGTLEDYGVKLRTVFNIRSTPAGLAATIDSPDQNATGIPASSVKRNGSTIVIEIDAAGAKFEGAIAKDLKTINGTFSQRGANLPLTLTLTSATAQAKASDVKPSDIDGSWLGTLEFSGMKLRIVFNFRNTPDGLTATADSPDQGAKGIPVSSVKRDGSSLTIEVKGVNAKFEGAIAKDLKSIDGTFTQGGGTQKLTLTPVKDTATIELRRPQNPVKPYPYRDEDVTYQNKSAGITLAATLTIPKGPGPFPAAVLITGSGPQDRDETLLGHRPFLVLSDYLTRHGIAVLRADDRGTAKSGGKFDTATTADFATDTEAGVDYLLTRPEIDAHKIGLIGHSEGGVIAPMIAARNPKVAFIVMMAGTGVNGEEIIIAQTKLISEAGGMSAEKVEKQTADQRATFAIVKQERDNAEMEKKLRAKLAGTVPETQIDGQIKTFGSPWMRYFLSYEPAPALQHVKCPVLVLNGEKDLQVPPKLNLPAIRKALEAGGNKDFEIDELPSLNHLFQTAKTGAPSEYSQIEETISPVALEKMSSWILKHTGPQTTSIETAPRP